jgi:hypothetical protein
MDSEKDLGKKEDIFWINKPSILFQKDNYYRIIPTKEMEWIEILNTLSRFFIYLFILYLFFSTDRKYLFIPIIALIVIIIIYQTRKDGINKKVEPKETFHDLQVPMTISNESNPNDNASLIDNENDKMTNHISQDDVINTDNGILAERQFFTIPSTTIPNDQTAFAKWLYGSHETCKQNQKKCLKYEDVRYKKYNPIIDTPSCFI